MVVTTKRLRQRSDYTYKFNARCGRHGWLRLTPAYSVKIVDEIIRQYPSDLSVIDPFSGTGTTALSAMIQGHRATAADINPFLTWIAQAKTARYDASAIAETEAAGKSALALAQSGTIAPAPNPPIHNVNRWWTPTALRFLRCLKAAIKQSAAGRTQVSDLLHIAFCRTLIEISNAAFNHQSMSFKDAPRQESDLPFNGEAAFMNNLRFILQGASENPLGSASVVQGDARNMPLCVNDALFDLVVTSPPYANRMSYIRELRPYMYWLGYLENRRDAGEMDWLSIGGTWGVATSRLSAWTKPRDRWLPDSLINTLADIARSDNPNGILLSNYVAKYFADMSTHFNGLRKILNRGARIHYIVGNSTFYGELVPTERIYAAMMRKYGFKHVDIRAVRKRNSKKALVEYEVSATWPKQR